MIVYGFELIEIKLNNKQNSLIRGLFLFEMLTGSLYQCYNYNQKGIKTMSKRKNAASCTNICPNSSPNIIPGLDEKKSSLNTNSFY